MKSWAFIHPELAKPWYTRARDHADAKKRFEDCWALRIPQGLLEDVDGSFFDGTVVGAENQVDDLCAYDLNGHFWQPDDRPERRAFSLPKVMAGLAGGVEQHPVVCLMCQATAWHSASGIR